MDYIDVMWCHAFEDEPVRLVSELNAERFEVRKLEFFRNGSVGFASQNAHSDGTELGLIPVPLLEEINIDPQFVGVAISGAEFEVLWGRCTKFDA